MQVDAPLNGKTILVTGATRGIGAAIVAALHADGAHVIGHYGRDSDAAAAFKTRYPERLDLVQADLMHPGTIDRLWQDALAVQGRVDVLGRVEIQDSHLL